MASKRYFLPTAIFFALVAVAVFSANAPSAHADAILATTTLGHPEDGTPSFTLSGTNNSPNDLGINQPGGVAVDAAGQRLFVDDSANNRVLVYPLTATGTLASHSPTYVLGQQNAFATGGDSIATSSATGLAIAYDHANQRLFVAERSHSRILIYNVDPSTIASGETASGVLGQPDLTTLSFAGLSSSTLEGVTALAYDSINQRLFVVDNYEGAGQRVLVFNVNVSTFTNGEGASYVLGQPDFTTDQDLGTSSTSLEDAEAVAFDSGWRAPVCGRRNHSARRCFQCRSGSDPNL